MGVPKMSAALIHGYAQTMSCGKELKQTLAEVYILTLSLVIM